MVDAEYGNQGVDFKFVAREGFGWTNSSFQVGVSFLSVAERRAVSACVSPEVFYAGHHLAGSEDVAPLVDPVQAALEGVNLDAH